LRLISCSILLTEYIEFLLSVHMRISKYIFPFFNSLIMALFGALVGYYIGHLAQSILIGFAVGLVLGVLVELLLGRLGQEHWLYHRRVLLLVLLEIPLAVFLSGPFAYVFVETQSSPHSICCETPLDYGAATFDEIEIQMDDGVLLSGWYVPPEKNPGPVVILLHGARGDRRGMAWHAQTLIEAGYGVLLYDQRAQGESTGDRVYWGWIEGHDLLQVIDSLESRPEVNADQIGAVGLSAGAHFALNAAHLEPGRIIALWLDGLQAQRIEDFPEPQNIGERFATLINALILKSAQWYLGLNAPPAFVDILADPDLDHVNMVIVAGGLDDFESRVSQKYAQAAGENAQVWLIDGAWHVGGQVVAPEDYAQRMLAFFDRYLNE
jgi:uncharacterized protein